MMFICWQEPSLNPWMAVGGRAVQPFMPPPQTPVKSTDPGPFAFSDDDYTRDILTQAGFKNIEFRPISCGMNLGANITEAIENQCRVGPAARVMRELSGSKRDQALDAMREAIAPWLTSEGLILGASAWLVSATV
jgi:hypothetical protein